MNDVAQETSGTGSSSDHTMARGTILLMMATVLFIGSGYIIHLVMARVISADEYGRFGVLLAMLQVIQVFLLKGIPDSVNKYVAEGRDTAQIKSIAIRTQGMFSIGICVLLILAAPFISDLLNDRDMAPFIMMIALIIPIRAIFSVYSGYVRGMRRFRDAGFLSNVNSASRVLFVLLFLGLGLGIQGAIGGYIAAAILSLFMGYRYSMGDIEGPDVTSSEVVHFGLPIIIYSACYLAIMNIDLLIAKALVSNPDSIGHYTAARLLASLILSATMALQLTLFPSISQSVSRDDHVQTRNYINGSMRYVLMALVPLSILLGIFSEQILTFLFPSEYSAGADSLSILGTAISFIAILILFGTILNGAGHPKLSATITFILVILSIPLNYFLISEHGIVGGAMAMFILGGVGMLTFAFFVHRNFGTIVNIRSLLRIFGAGTVMGIIAYLIEPTTATVVPMSAVLLMINIGLLFLFREVGDEDIKIVKALIGRS
jgi:O-antigen/teichoic acid export membrane protein